MGEGPAPAVEAGHRHGIYLPLLDENQEAVQPRTPILRTGNPDVGMLGDDGPATGRRVLSEVEQLILNCLFFSVRLDLFRAHAGIKSHSHSRSPPSADGEESPLCFIRRFRSFWGLTDHRAVIPYSKEM